jgi:hypothetical protein
MKRMPTAEIITFRRAAPAFGRVFLSLDPPKIVDGSAL